MNKLIVIPLFGIVLLLIDLYVFQAVKVVAMDFSPLARKITFISYWALTGLVIAGYIAYNFGNPDSYPKTSRAFMLVGVISAFAGVVASLHVTYFWPSLGDGYLLRTLASVFLGGTSVFGGVGTIFGSFIGAFMIGAIEAATVAVGLTGFWTQLIYGLIIVLSVTMHAYLRKKME